MVRASCAVVSTGMLVSVSTMGTHPEHEVDLPVPAWATRCRLLINDMYFADPTQNS